MKDWWHHLNIPKEENLARVGSAKSFESMLKAGCDIARRINSNIDEFIVNPNAKVLDFGCGCGRVALPMYYEFNRLTHACDIDTSAIDYLKTVFDQVDLSVSGFKPPLHFSDNTFDAVYAISVWTHLNEEDQLAWLAEMRRVIKPGGILMPTTSSYKAIDHRRDNMKIPAWKDVRSEDLREAGIMYRESATLKTAAAKWFPGVTDSYGQTSNDPAYIINRWSDYFTIKRHYINEIGGIQDLNVLVNDK